MKQDLTSVYYVDFMGPGRGVQGRRFLDVEDDNGAKILREPVMLDEDLQRNERMPGQTMSATFSWREVAKIFDISEGRLRYWDSSAFISPTGHDGRRCCFTFQDLISIRSAMALLAGGVSLQKTRRIIEDLKDKLPRSSHPLDRLRIKSDANTIVIIEDGHEFEADSGQLLMDFSVKSIKESIVAQLPSRAYAAPESRTAYEWYLEGCGLDDDEECLGQAEEAYHRAIYLDPTLANAYTNLGNLRYRAGSVQDAKILYAKAIEVDRDQPEAHYNLGFLGFEDGDLDAAAECFRRAVELDATFADAHFNLAMTLFRLNQDDTARVHWKRYLALEPTGPWADIARRRLQEVN